MPAPTITPLPAAPSRSTDPATFAIEADAFVGALPAFGTQANAQASYLDALAIAADADAVAAAASAVDAEGFADDAAASAANAAAAADVSAWVSGATYAIGVCVFSPIDFQTYRRATNGAGTTDPSADAVNWVQISTESGVFGPASSTSNAIALFDGASGALIKNGPLPGAAGNILISNGTAWTSATPAPAGAILQAVASGSLSNGSTVVINADGTVSAVASSGSSVGTASVFNSASHTFAAASYDIVSRRVIIVYKSTGTYGTAVVGTVSGNNISFGTPVVFYSNVTNNIKIINTQNNGRFVIAFTDQSNNNQGAMIVLKVTENAITFGARATFNFNTPTYDFGLAYDKVNDRALVAYVNTGNSNFGTALSFTVSDITLTAVGSPVVFNSASTSFVTATYNDATRNNLIIYNRTAKVATLTPTSINFGTAATISGSGNAAYPSATYDSASQRVVLAYADGGNSDYGTAVVGTVTGTTVTFGTPVLFLSGPIFGSNGLAATYDAASQRVVIAYRNTASGSFGSAIAGTVSGSTISFASPVFFNSAISNEIGIAYSPVDQRVIIAYADSGNSSFGTAITFRAINTNLSGENFIGISAAAYTNGQTATIQIASSIDDAQSGLTPGRSYFVQNNGTLGLTPANVFAPVFAGTAVEANRIIVKG